PTTRGLGLAALAATMSTVVPRTASAADEGSLFEFRHERYHSPQNFALEFRFSPYTPDIDSAPDVQGTPYRNTFGTMPRLLFSVEFDWQALRIPHLGSLGPAIGAGTTSMDDKASLASPVPPGTPGTCGTNKSCEDTGLAIYPMWAGAVFRADVVQRDLG